MTPANIDTPLRRSEITLNRESVGGNNVTINDDDEERRVARRRTLIMNLSSDTTSPGIFEENETLKKCLEIYNGNRLCTDNAWSMSLIDTLSTLLERHHKSLNNFKVAGSTLEASSRVYGLRVDSIHTDVLRMSAGLNAQKFNEKQSRGDDDDDDGAADGVANNSGPDGENAAKATTAPGSKKPKRQRRLVSTITKNKDTINARLDTLPVQDPVFGKLNTTVGSINSSSRLMNNILLTTNSELRLRTNFRFWDACVLVQCDFTEEVSCEESDSMLAPCDRLFKIEQYELMQVRPNHGGYVISDTAEVITDDVDKRRLSLDSNNSGRADGGEGFNDNFCQSAEISMAFDINAECEPLPAPGSEIAAPILDVDYADLEEMSTEERMAINNCRGLLKAAVHIDDLRPVDASSKLEYSYRPLDKISQFWAGPSHWKFKRSRTRGSTIHGQQVLGASERQNGRTFNQRSKRAAALLAKQRTKQLNFGEYHDDLFIKLDEKFKSRKVNIQKKWDQRKLKLPTDLQIGSMIFYKYTYAPGLSPGQSELQESSRPHCSDDTDDEHPNLSMPQDGDHFGDADSGLGIANHMQVSELGSDTISSGRQDFGDGDAPGEDNMNACNTTVLEIGTDFEGAPSQVTKIIVPFAKRAKVIDMKNLKRCCSELLTKHLSRPINQQDIPSHPLIKGEKYMEGVASFQEIYNNLPELLTPNMVDSLTPSIAFYSMLHLANDLKLRLIPQDDLEDFKIRQVM